MGGKAEGRVWCQHCLEHRSKAVTIRRRKAFLTFCASSLILTLPPLTFFCFCLFFSHLPPCYFGSPSSQAPALLTLQLYLEASFLKAIFFRSLPFISLFSSVLVFWMGVWAHFLVLLRNINSKEEKDIINFGACFDFERVFSL